MAANCGAPWPHGTACSCTPWTHRAALLRVAASCRRYRRNPACAGSPKTPWGSRCLCALSAAAQARKTHALPHVDPGGGGILKIPPPPKPQQALRQNPPQQLRLIPPPCHLPELVEVYSIAIQGCLSVEHRDRLPAYEAPDQSAICVAIQ